mgnify:CR=1 FL=1
MTTIYEIGPVEAGTALAQRLRELRLLKGWTRETLAQRAGVTSASLKRFENTGKASVVLVLKAAHALNRLDEFDALLRPPAARSMAELEQRQTQPTRKRGVI